MRAKNPYSLSQLSVLKQELTNNLDYVVDFPVANIEDDIDYKPAAKGGINPTVVSTIEKKLKTCIGVITQCSKIVLSIYDKEIPIMIMCQWDFDDTEIEGDDEYINQFSKGNYVNCYI